MSIVAESIAELLERDLNRLSNEIEAYKNEENLWLVDGEITNSAGNLALHLCGNLQHFIGAVIGKSGYERNREFEFSGKDVPREALLKDIETTKDIVHQTLLRIPESTLNYPYPIRVFGDKDMSTVFFLVHLQGHLNYHLGQINYHRRLLDK
ncbi:MAG: DinB superfamily protein [Cytophagales bacterium CG12_big_fil_rev_8_21_14_0_65_40_12]|nr:MAG: DinB superfamily protein [Cytophagales bacterium CG12_big_fil_rev_8_21_14_0_65_40_12]PIW05223.1 MAG: DinB superfamily protein [Cytophagales bacterium CG17_big_fil_post_rev_8_21_14_2_50_40_13]